MACLVFDITPMRVVLFKCFIFSNYYCLQHENVSLCRVRYHVFVLDNQMYFVTINSNVVAQMLTIFSKVVMKITLYSSKVVSLIKGFWFC
jgi:uncharacterized protein YhbP (UPF0306 family)